MIRLHQVCKKAKKIFCKPEISQEAFDAYFFRLPEKVEVGWFRDGNYIVGKVKTDKKEFMTQGVNPQDFIEMVNDAIYTVSNIPEDYIDILRKVKTYSPPPQEKKKLEDLNIKKSFISLEKQKHNALRLA